MSEPKNQSTGIHLEDCEDIHLEDNVFAGFEKAVLAVRTKRLRATGNLILEDIPSEILADVLKAVSEGRKAGDVPAPEDVEKSLSDKARSWLVEHGVDLASFAVAVAGLFK